jgi:hypothetical protein
MHDLAYELRRILILRTTVNKDALGSIVRAQRLGEVHQVVADGGSLGRRTARFLGVVVLVAVLVGILLVLLEWYITPRGAEQKQALIVTIAQIVGGTALLLGLYFTWRRVEISQRTLEATQDQQVTERFTRAIDQLGATDETGKPRLEVRLGGIYALERIANDSPDRDYSTIMEVLTAYVRENAPRRQEVISSPASDPSEPKTATEPANQELPTPLADIQAILTVLGRRKKAGQAGDVVLDLSATDLRGAHLEGARLNKVSLRRADLRRAHLEGAVLREARLEGAELERADLEGADVRGANLLLYVTAGDDRHTIWDLRKYTIAELSGGGLTQEQLDETIGDESTLFPSDLERPEHWGVKPDD